VADNLDYEEPMPTGLLSNEAMIMHATGWSWRELLETPETIVDEILAIKRGEGEYYDRERDK